MGTLYRYRESLNAETQEVLRAAKSERNDELRLIKRGRGKQPQRRPRHRNGLKPLFGDRFADISRIELGWMPGNCSIRARRLVCLIRKAVHRFHTLRQGFDQSAAPA